MSDQCYGHSQSVSRAINEQTTEKRFVIVMVLGDTMTCLRDAPQTDTLAIFSNDSWTDTKRFASERNAQEYLATRFPNRKDLAVFPAQPIKDDRRFYGSGVQLL
jgi:hypothetical protein